MRVAIYYTAPIYALREHSSSAIILYLLRYISKYALLPGKLLADFRVRVSCWQIFESGKAIKIPASA